MVHFECLMWVSDVGLDHCQLSISLVEDLEHNLERIDEARRAEDTRGAAGADDAPDLADHQLASA